MENNFVEANSGNLPKIDALMVGLFFKNNPDFCAAELKNVKTAFKIRNTSTSTIYYRCPFNISECQNTLGKSQYIVIYNPLAWHVTVPVRIPTVYTNYNVIDSIGNIIKANILPVPSGVENIAERNTVANLELVFMANNLPPLGFRAYYLEILRGNKRVPKATKSYKKSLGKLKKHPVFYWKSLNNTKQYNKGIEKKRIYTLIERAKDSIDYMDDSENKPKNISPYFSKSVEKKYIDVIGTPKTNVTGEFSFNITTENTETQVAENTTEDPRDIEDTPDKKDTEDTEETEDTTNSTENTTHLTEYTTNLTKNTNDLTEYTTNSTDTIAFRVYTTTNIIEYNVTEVAVANTTETNITNATIKESTSDENIGMDKEEGVSLNNSSINDTSVDVDYEFESSQNMSLSNVGYISDTLFIKNKFIRLNLDSKAKRIKSISLTDELSISFDIQFYYYEAYEHKPQKGKKSHQRSSGAYIFKPTKETPVLISEDVRIRVIKSEIVEELHVSTSDVTYFVARLYNETPYLEVDWIVGPIPVDDKLGKEIIVKYKTDLKNERTFFTDSNGRQTIKRRVNERASYKYSKILPITGNYYPVTSKIYIEDLEKNIRFTVLNDRPQGGSSINEGEIELMLHRRLITDDSNMNIYLNETMGDNGITVRGKHYICISAADKRQSRIFEKKFAKEIQLHPQILVSKRDVDMGLTKFLNVKNQFSALKNKLPVGIHMLTLEPCGNNTLLLRLENYLEKNDVGHLRTKRVFINKLFKHLKINEVKEALLGANIWREQLNPLQWRTENYFVKNFNEFYGSSEKPHYVDNNVVDDNKVEYWEEGINLKPMEIRTFIVKYTYYSEGY